MIAKTKLEAVALLVYLILTSGVCIFAVLLAIEANSALETQERAQAECLKAFDSLEATISVFNLKMYYMQSVLDSLKASCLASDAMTTVTGTTISAVRDTMKDALNEVSQSWMEYSGEAGR